MNIQNLPLYISCLHIWSGCVQNFKQVVTLDILLEMWSPHLTRWAIDQLLLCVEAAGLSGDSCSYVLVQPHPSSLKLTLCKLDKVGLMSTEIQDLWVSAEPPLFQIWTNLRPIRQQASKCTSIHNHMQQNCHICNFMSYYGKRISLCARNPNCIARQLTVILTPSALSTSVHVPRALQVTREIWTLCELVWRQPSLIQLWSNLRQPLVIQYESASGSHHCSSYGPISSSHWVIQGSHHSLSYGPIPGSHHCSSYGPISGSQ